MVARLLLVLAVVATGLIVIGAPAAYAGQSSPPTTDGQVVFSTGIAQVHCRDGVPQSVDFSFDWDGTRLYGGFPASARLLVQTGGIPDIVDRGAVAVPIAAGEAARFTHSFPLQADDLGRRLYLTVDQSVSYSVMDTQAIVRCDGATANAAVAPRVTVTDDCAGGAQIDFSGSGITQNWSWVALVEEGFYIGTSDDFLIKPGSGYSRHLDHISGRLVLRVSSTDPVTGLTDHLQLGIWYIKPTCSPGTLVSVSPFRILDTRSAVGGSGPVGPFGTTDLLVAGRGGVPLSGVSAVAVNITVVSPSREGYLTAWPSTGVQPLASNLNFVSGQTVPNFAIVPVGSDGRIKLFNGSPGTVQMVADVAGYYLSGSALGAGTFTAVDPVRLLDTRVSVGYSGPVEANGTVSLLVAGRGGVPLSGVSAVAVNITVVSPSREGYLTAWPSTGVQPLASNLNFVSGQTVPNFAIVPVGSDGRIKLFNGSPGTVQMVADVAGFSS